MTSLPVEILDLPASDAQNGPDAVQLCFDLALADQELDVKEVDGRLDAQGREEEGLGKVLGHLVLAFEKVADGVEERAGRPHMADRSPRPAPKEKSKFKFGKFYS